jgi:hypothetical protein
VCLTTPQAASTWQLTYAPGSASARATRHHVEAAALPNEQLFESASLSKMLQATHLSFFCSIAMKPSAIVAILSAWLVEAHCSFFVRPNTSQRVVRSFSKSQVIASHCDGSLNKKKKLVFFGATFLSVNHITAAYWLTS